MNHTLKRLQEPSTWASIAVLLSLFGFSQPDETAPVIIQAGTGIAGLLGIILGEKGGS